MKMTLELPFFRKSGEGRPALGDNGELLTAPIHGKYYYAARRNRLYVASSATGGIAIIQAATGGGHPTIWNPLGSGRILSVKRLLIGYVSGNNAPTSLAWNLVENAGSQPATGSPILTATKVAVVNAMAGGPVDAKTYFSPTTNTFTAAPAFWRPTNLSLFTGVAATAVAPFTWGEEYDDDLLIEEGAAICLVTQAATTTALFRYSVLVEEKDK